MNSYKGFTWSHINRYAPTLGNVSNKCKAVKILATVPVRGPPGGRVVYMRDIFILNKICAQD
jgi:hypothetical protein